MIRFPFNERKAAQAAAFLVWKHEGELDYRRLVKLLYLADREALLCRDFPICGGNLWSMRQGPVLGDVMRCVKHQLGHGRVWDQFLAPKEPDHTIRLRSEEFDTNELSDSEILIIEAIHAKFGQMSDEELLAHVHGLPEYTHVERGRFPILIERLLAEEHVPPDRVSGIKALADEIDFAKRAGAVCP